MRVEGYPVDKGGVLVAIVHEPSADPLGNVCIADAREGAVADCCAVVLKLRQERALLKTKLPLPVFTAKHRGGEAMHRLGVITGVGQERWPATLVIARWQGKRCPSTRISAKFPGFA